MTDLEALRDASVPRDDALTARFAAAFEEREGFILYGILCFLAVNVVPMVVGFVISELGKALLGHAPSALMLLVFGAWVVAFLTWWWPFARWVKRRRGDARRLFREGVLLEGTLVGVQRGVSRSGAYTKSLIEFESAGARCRTTIFLSGHENGLVNGEAIPVLFVGGYRFCAAFPPDGKLVVGY